MLTKTVLLLLLLTTQTYAVSLRNPDDIDDLDPEVFIETDYGCHKVIGTRNESWNGEKFYAFRGIPFAQPPIGELRFQDPKLVLQYPKVIDARYDGHDCPSIFASNASEDCLVLNIYAKNLKPKTSLPVIVFIHPGGLYAGSSVSTFIGPEYLMAKDVILVTFNYRLSTLGFLNLGTKDVPGNAGFKDQVYALRWIKKYIKYFGGNANDITLVGYSAGALSTSLHLVSPMAKDLFQKAIIMSGSLPPQAILPEGNQLALARKQAKVLNCNGSSENAEILNCLNKYSGVEIAATLRLMFDFGNDHPIYLWLPVIEHDFGQERFLTEDYYDVLSRGHFIKIPLLIGYTDGEFCNAAAEILQDEQLSYRFYNDFDNVAPKVFIYEKHAAPNVSQINTALFDHYFKDNATNDANFVQLCNIISDAIIRFGAERLATLTADSSKVYSYVFTHKGAHSNFQYNASEPRVEHMDDLQYLFQMEPRILTTDEAEASIVQLYTNFIYDFAADKNPYNDTVARYPDGYFLIAANLQLKSGKYFKAADFWNKLVS